MNSAIEVSLNLPTKMSDIFVADITRCYESIPLIGNDNLSDAIAHIIRLGFKQERSKYPRSSPQIWIRVDSSGNAAHAAWGTCHPSYGDCFALLEDRLILLHTWLMNHCFVGLGDRVWKQSLGIPMGFSCSPLWCNLYVLHYEINFILRLGRLGMVHLLKRFKHAFRYIDDLCWINNGNALEFLSPSQIRTPDNPFWIYPLDVLEIKCEVSDFAKDAPERGIKAHFMNLEISIDENQPGLYQTAKFDKRRALPFKFTQYIRFRSNRPIRQSYSIPVSQTVPILYLSSTFSAALFEIEKLILTLQENGFQKPQLICTITRFLEENAFPGLKFDLSTLIEHLR